MESRVRSIAKTFSWRFFATLITMLIAWIVTGKAESGFAIGLADTFIKLFGFYFHERAWNRISLKKLSESFRFIRWNEPVCTSPSGPGPVMLVLFSDRNPDRAVELAFEKAKNSGELVLVYVIDDNLAPYFVGTDAGLYPALKEICEQDLLKKYRQEAADQIDRIVQRARTRGIRIKKHLLTKSAYQKNTTLIQDEKPALIISDEKKKRFGLKLFLREPIINLLKNTGVPVINV